MRRKSLIKSLLVVLAVLLAGGLGVAAGIYYQKSQEVTDDGQLKASRLLPLLRHKDPQVRRATVDIIKEIGMTDPVCMASLQEVALGDGDSMVRYSAFDAVTRAGGKGAIPFLIQALKHSDAGVRQQAARSLGQLKAREAFTPLVKLFEREMQKARRQPAARQEAAVLAGALARVNPGASLPYVLRAMQAMPGNPMMRRLVAQAATKEEAPALADFGMKIPNNNTGTHLAVIKAFRKLRDRSAVPYLVKQLKNPSESVRREAAMALSQTAGRDRFEDLAAAVRKQIESLNKLPEGRTPRGISEWLGALRSAGDPRACAVFLEIAESCKHRSVRVLAARQMRVCVEPKLGARIYKLYKQTKDQHLQRMLKLVLAQAPGYGYKWDEKAKDFRRTGAVVKPEPKPKPKPPAKKAEKF
jgi:HEAT repeat protein